MLGIEQLQDSNPGTLQLVQSLVYPVNIQQPFKHHKSGGPDKLKKTKVTLKHSLFPDLFKYNPRIPGAEGIHQSTYKASKANIVKLKRRYYLDYFGNSIMSDIVKAIIHSFEKVS